jgi:hypothetical protein
MVPDATPASLHFGDGEVDVRDVHVSLPLRRDLFGEVLRHRLGAAAGPCSLRNMVYDDPWNGCAFQPRISV